MSDQHVPATHTPQDEPQPPSAPTVDVAALRATAEAALASREIDDFVSYHFETLISMEEMRYLAASGPDAVLQLLDRLAALEAALLTRVPMRNHGSAMVCGCCGGVLALVQVGPGCCGMTGLHEAGCAVAELITLEMARAALGRPGTEGQPCVTPSPRR